jgi:integrase
MSTARRYNDKSTIRYILLTDKPDKQGFCPIRLIYQIKNQKKYFLPNQKLLPINWDVKNQEAIYVNRQTAKKILPEIDYDLLPSVSEVEEINLELDTKRNRIRKIEDNFEEQGIRYSLDMVIDLLKKSQGTTTKSEAPRNQVYDFIDKYIKDNQASRVRGSLSVYKSLKNHLKNFEIKRKQKVTFDKIDYAFFLEFQNFLISTTARGAPDGLGNVTIAKILSTLKTFLNYAKMNGIPVSGLYESFVIKKEDLEVIALTNEEFEALWHFNLSRNKKWDQVRDVFCFSCATGFRYSDLKQLKREHINIATETISMTVTKTKERLVIPINPCSRAIIKKYSNDPKPLPVISNDKMNEYIKEICEDVGINEPVQIVRYRGAKREENTYPKYKLVSVHTGRKTFATLSLEKGISAEEVMKMGGWKTYASFSRYVNITPKRLKVVSDKAWESWGGPRMKILKGGRKDNLKTGN